MQPHTYSNQSRHSDQRVDARRISGQHVSRGRRERRQVALHRSREAQPPVQRIPGDTSRPGHLRRPAEAAAPVVVHLPQPVSGVHEALGDERVVLARRPAVRHAVPVPDHLDRPVQPA